MRHVKVIANCHCLPVADALALCVEGVTTDFIDVNFAHTAEMQRRIAELEPALSGQIVYTQPLSDRFDTIATDALRQRLGANSVATFTNVYFSGLHPDITYIGQMGARLQSFFGDYHSKLVLFCYVTGRSTADCRNMFDASVYEKIGYLDAFRLSSEELLGRDKSIDVRFAEQFLELARKTPTMYTVNHPTGPVILALAEALAHHSGLSFVRFDPTHFQNHLASNYIWPVYDAIAEHNRLEFRSALYFVTNFRRQSRAISLPDFIAGSYAAYSAVETEAMQQAVKALPFYNSFAEALGA